MRSRSLQLALCIGSALGICSGVDADAQATADPSSTSDAAQITEIIVTARRTEERLQDVPISMSVYNQQQLIDRNVVNAADLANFTPSLSANSNFGTPPSVGTYFADVVAPRGPTQGTQAGDGAGPGSFFDLQNLQVLKGPQGTLFGRNTTGGAVLFVPQKPTSRFEGYAEASYGKYDMYRVQGALNAPLGENHRLRVAVDHQERDGYLHNVSGIGPEYYNDVNYTAARASFVSDLTPNLENYLIASYSESDTHGSVQKLIDCNPAGFNPPDPSIGLANFVGLFSCGQLAAERAQGNGFYDLQAAVPNPMSRIEQWQVIDTATWNVTDTLTIKNIASYARFKDRQRSPLFGTNWQASTLPQPYPFVVGAVNYTAGKTTFRNRGVYAQSSYGLTDRFKLTAGARYTWDEQTNTAQRVTYNFPVLPPFTGPATARCTDPSTGPSCTQSLEQKSDKPTWLIGLDYQPGDDVLVYGKYARGYRAGGVFTNAPFDLRTFEPEKVDNFELGLKTAFRAAVSGTFNLAVFYNDFSNQQLQFGFDARVDPATGATAPVSPTTATVNAGKSEIYGAEVEVSVAPLAGWVLDASYTYLNAKLKQIDPIASADPNYQSATVAFAPDSALVLSPKNKYSLTANYTLPLDRSLGRIGLGATFVHTDEQLTTYAYQDPAIRAAFGNLGTLAARDVLNLNLNWDSIAGAPIDAALFATNVTQQEYYQYVPGLATSGSEFAVLGEPRMYGIRMRYRFGE